MNKKETLAKCLDALPVMTGSLTQLKQECILYDLYYYISDQSDYSVNNITPGS